MEKIIIFDSTLRDGEQSPGASLNTKQKLEIAQQLSVLGVDVIEAGFPIASEGDFEAVSLVAKKVKGPVICGLARALKKDIDVCFDAVKHSKRRRIHTFLATSPIHMKYKLKMSQDQVFQAAIDAVRYAKNKTDDVEFSPEDAARSEIDFLCRIVEGVIDAGATAVNIPDTVGYSVPSEFGQIISKLYSRVPNIHRAVISVHCHNDLGLATSNSLSAIINGARQVECTINGLGERAGNASLEEIVMSLYVRKNFFNVYTDIKTSEISKTSKLVSSLTGMVIQPNKAIVGSNAFAHEAGIHQHGVLAKATTYEIMTPQSIGLKSSELVLGKHSGRHAFEKKVKELGFRLAQKEFEKAFNDFKALADKKKNIYDEDIEAIVENEISREKQIYELESIFITSGSAVRPLAKIKLRKDGKFFSAEASGDGPVDSAYKAIEEIIAQRFKLIDYSLKSVSIGKDAVGEAMVKVEYKGMVYLGRGTSTDVIEASVKAFLSAINRILRNIKGRD
ncbi:MAG: 2-isopropylmalate synthase [Elusimicrobia bacterium RIFOXYC2_FULL_34_12]|nr:MAG: 2-isopropylmalate synthase [Elusimicrobia bacterium RIFOXYC2_FULL_34_12]HAM39565.1 2-isopropylmalate synthase [Elusimicrobiota bacterium]